jgi:hypothetical protein
MGTNGRQKEYCVKDNKCVLKQAGKGDMPRPSDKQKYDEGYNSINWSNKKKKKREK